MDSASALITAAFSGAAVLIGAIAAFKRVGANERVRTNAFAALLARWRDWAQASGHYDDGNGSAPESLRKDTDNALDGDGK